MNITDLINGLWELLGALMIIPSIMSTINNIDKKPVGISWSTVIFFTAWGTWNVYFYPVNDLIYSFVGGLILLLVNLFWVLLLIIATYKNK